MYNLENKYKLEKKLMDLMKCKKCNGNLGYDHKLYMIVECRHLICSR